ncbi:unnamed protein product [Caenorhabditis angaria]|uniref:Myeloid leukemia factor n=1 Tax=Caenorhabditis angaria TaxID=860376 RepID=A0A9P1N0M3_9PELO|nr:unnamed protein product [Caenorhabditis angaria]
MFDDDDFPFRAMGAMGQMHRAMMQDMDSMMSSMLGGSSMPRGGPMGGGPFGFPGFGGPMFGAMPALMDGSGQRPTRRRQELEMDPFAGFGGLLGAMTNPRMMMMPPVGSSGTAPNMFVSTSMMTMGPDGKPRVEQQTMHKTGNVTETKKRVDQNGESTMTIGHSIGDRSHYIEKKRDKDGNVRKNQKFVNLDEASAEDFDREFSHRVRANYGYGSGRSHPTSAAIENSSRNNPRHTVSSSSSSANSSRNPPIITLPDEDEPNSSYQSSSSNHRNGPIIREISEEEAEQSIPKRRKGQFGRTFREQ